MLATLFTLLFLFLVPAAALYFEGYARAAGAVGLCFLAGFLVAVTPGVSIDKGLAANVSVLSVALAIPLLLLSLDLRMWLRRAPSAALAFGWAAVAVALASAIAAPFFAERVVDGGKVAGMLVGTYTGGPPNLAAVGTMLGASRETIVAVTAADALVSTPYHILLITVGPELFGLVFPSRETAVDDSPSRSRSEVHARDVLIGLGLAAVAVGAGVTASQLTAGLLPDEVVAILVITTVALGLSFHPRVRALRGTLQAGNYLMLVFCVTMGAVVDFGEVVRSSPWIVGYTTAVVVLSIAIHVALCRLTRIDRDTAIITSAAAVFGPAFIGPIAVRLGNRDVFVSGLMASLVGYALGNYLGLLVAWVLA